jgi:hypothetical protein
MSTIHLTNGDVAADSLRSALRQAGRDDPVRSLRDDLAVGPLRGVDDTPEVRAEFWQRVTDGAPHDGAPRNFQGEFTEQATLLEQLVAGDTQVAVWHAESAADQLTLRRVCYHLRNSPQRLNEVRLSIRDLTDPSAFAHSRPDHATSVGMFAPDILQTRLPDVAPISVLRISRLALEWQEVKHALILEHASDAWRPAARIAAQLMVADLGFLVSDSLVFWRFRELAASGRVSLRGDPSAWRALELRADLSTCSS